MDNLQLSQAPIAKAELLIRRPVGEVFDAFINPAVTTKFWFTKSSGPLVAGQHVEWVWEMYGVVAEVEVKAIEDNKRILIEWGGGDEVPTLVEWIFTPYGADTTFVSVTNSGFKGTGDEVVAQALNSTGGFMLVLAGAKARLEHDLNLNVIVDGFPPAQADTK